MAEFAATTRPRSAGGGRHPRYLSGGLFGGARVCLVVLAVVGSVLAVAPVAAAQGQRFPDVAADHYAFEAVEWAVEAGVTAGYTDGTFKPQRPLIRRHALVFMERYYDEILGADESEDFTRGDMMVLLKAINDGTLRGETPQDAASGTGGAAQGQRFPDVAADHYAFEAVEWAVEAGVTTGYTDGTFKPQRPLIRRHALVFMERYYDEILGADESKDFTRADMMVLLKAINDGTIRTRPPGAGSATADIEPAISISDTHGCKLSADGRLTCWGDNTHGQATPAPGHLHRHRRQHGLLLRHPNRRPTRLLGRRRRRLRATTTAAHLPARRGIHRRHSKLLAPLRPPRRRRHRLLGRQPLRIPRWRVHRPPAIGHLHRHLARIPRRLRRQNRPIHPMLGKCIPSLHYRDRTQPTRHLHRGRRHKPQPPQPRLRAPHR